VRTILVETGYGRTVTGCSPDHRVPTVVEAIRLVLDGVSPA